MDPLWLVAPEGKVVGHCGINLHLNFTLLLLFVLTFVDENHEEVANKDEKHYEEECSPV